MSIEFDPNRNVNRAEEAEDSPEPSVDESQESTEEGGEGLKPNDLVVAERHIEKARKLLSSVNIDFEDREHTKHVQVNETSAVPGTFAISLKDVEGNDEASPDAIRQAFEFLRDSGIVVKYAKIPARS